MANIKTESFNTQPPEGGCDKSGDFVEVAECFNTQPPEGGCHLIVPIIAYLREFQHTAARRRLLKPRHCYRARSWFQHTAARRRLPTAR